MPSVESVHVRRVVPSAAFAPDTPFPVRIEMENRGTAPVLVTWEERIPAVYTASVLPANPFEIPAGGRHVLSYELRTSVEGPAVLSGVLTVEAPGGGSVAVRTPVACYPIARVALAEQLVDVRDRIRTVVNFDTLNGLLLLLDGARFLREHCNIEMSPEVVRVVADQWAGAISPDLPSDTFGPVFDGDVGSHDEQGRPLEVIFGIRRVELFDEWDECRQTYQPRFSEYPRS